MARQLGRGRRQDHRSHSLAVTDRPGRSLRRCLPEPRWDHMANEQEFGPGHEMPDSLRSSSRDGRLHEAGCCLHIPLSARSVRPCRCRGEADHAAVRRIRCQWQSRVANGGSGRRALAREAGAGLHECKAEQVEPAPLGRAFGGNRESAASPIPQMRSRGDASTSTRFFVARR